MGPSATTSCTTSWPPASGTPRRWKRLCCGEADRLVGGERRLLIIDDTALPKKGKHSVGVAPQYASALGKNANCQTLVSLTLASGEVPVMVGLAAVFARELDERSRPARPAGVPRSIAPPGPSPRSRWPRSTGLSAAGVRFGCVLADAGYGLSAAFRQGLSERGLLWAVGIPFKQKVYPADVAMIFPVAGRGRPRKRHMPDVTSITAQTMLERASWRTVSWRRGTKGRLSAPASPPSVFGLPTARPSGSATWAPQHLPGEEVWLIGEHRSTGERKYYLSNLPADTRSSISPAPSRRAGSASRRISS